MPFTIRPMEERDIAQSAEIELDAFPGLFPRTSFRRELQNRMASYLVAWRHDDIVDGQEAGMLVSGPPSENGSRPFLGRLLRNARSRWAARYSARSPGQQFITGFLGTWYMSDEAHIVSVGVRRDYRAQGIGELLLIGAIEQAVARRAGVVTLEVRPSNHVARNLYLKYGFTERGLRKGYYSDNREDAIIMTTEAIQQASFADRYESLVEAHQLRWGLAERMVI